MRTWDRLAAGEMVVPAGQPDFREVTTGLVTLSRENRAPVIVADNVAKYVHARNDPLSFDAYPSLAPPWEGFWVEYPSSSGLQRRLAFVHQGHEGFPGMPETDEASLFRRAREDAAGNGFAGDDVRWTIGMTLYVEQDRKVWGPAGQICLALDHDGRVAGNSWILSPVIAEIEKVKRGVQQSATAKQEREAGDTPWSSTEWVMPEPPRGWEFDLNEEQARQMIADSQEWDGQAREYIAKLEQRVEELDEARRSIALLGTDESGPKFDDPNAAQLWLWKALTPALQTIAFLHCRNVTTQEVIPPGKVQSKRRKNGKPPLTRYHTLHLDVPRRSGPSGSRRVYELGDPALHTVPGHFAHYGACCSNHPPNGLLFGKFEGVYWMPTHMRGNPQRGESRADYEIKPIDQGALDG